MKNTIILIMMFFALSAQAQQKREYKNILESVTTDSINGELVHFKGWTYKAYVSDYSMNLGQIEAVIESCRQDSMMWQESIDPIIAHYQLIKNDSTNFKAIEMLKGYYKSNQIQLGNTMSRKSAYESLKGLVE